MIKFIKTQPYQLRPPNEDIYMYLTSIGLQIFDPPPLQPQQLVTTASNVYYSPLKRVKESLILQSNTKYIEVAELAEIPFDLHQLCSKKLWEKEGSIAVRREFVKAYVASKLPVATQDLIKQTKDILRILAKYPEETSIEAISHSFRLKLIEAFIDTEGRLEYQPELITYFIHPDQKTFAFGESFEVSKIQITQALKNT